MVKTALIFHFKQLYPSKNLTLLTSWLSDMELRNNSTFYYWVLLKKWKVKNVWFHIYAVYKLCILVTICFCYWPISCHSSLSIPPENIKNLWGYRKRTMAWNGLRAPWCIYLNNSLINWKWLDLTKKSRTAIRKLQIKSNTGAVKFCKNFLNFSYPFNLFKIILVNW